ncbi:MAG: hypothetical protein ABIA59_02740 [Candidatus Latescibacterota bacterium]
MTFTSYAQMRKEAAAYREAGHAVAAWSLGILLEPLSIKKRGVRIQENAWNQPLVGIDTDWVRAVQADMLIERLAFVCLAGPVAERRRQRKGPREALYQERIQNAEALLGNLIDSPSQLAKQKRTLESQAENMFDSRNMWNLTESLAQALLKQGTLSSKAALKILQGSK